MVEIPFLKKKQGSHGHHLPDDSGCVDRHLPWIFIFKTVIKE